VPFVHAKVSHSNSNLWFLKPNKIDLKDFVTRPKFDQAALDLSFTKHMVAIDGVQPDIAENVREHGFEASPAQLESTHIEMKASRLEAATDVQKVLSSHN
jgi:hypothetical protein